MSSEHILSRDISATVIPAGDTVTLKAGTSAHVMQTLGGSVTVRTDHGLFRIQREDADALAGFDVATLAAASPATGEFSEQAVWAAMKTCFDPEIPVNIVDLGLVYDLNIEKGRAGGHVVEVKMTLTAQGCGMGPTIAEDARQKIAALPTVESAKVYIVWDPIWTPQMISPEGRKTLGLE
ncbi:MAG TPA: iron-sulfur cluster assembly protein [Rariglobus sp.]|jgi:probable FeS assembly SUF system protein SufT|nr:iron-sulfur cluster assembly protein [Rariglobus sp.]